MARTHTHTQSFNGPLSGTTQVSQYQKKHSTTQTLQEKKFAQTTRSTAWELIPFMALLSQRGLSVPYGIKVKK